MKLCDRCFQLGDHRPAPHVASIGVEEYDLCESCKETVRSAILEPEKPDAGKTKKRRPKRKPKAAKTDEP